MLLWYKPVCISGVSTGTGATLTAQDNMIAMLSFLNMTIMNQPRLAIPTVMNQAGEDGKLELSQSLEFLKTQVDAFIKFVEKNK